MTGRGLVPLLRDRCPDCGAQLDVTTAAQPALLRHGGYGADRVHVWRSCPACSWLLLAAVLSGPPLRSALTWAA